MSKSRCFADFVAEVEADPEQMALLDAARERLRGDERPGDGVAVPRGPLPEKPSSGAAADA